jgi:hypothetical protein
VLEFDAHKRRHHNVAQKRKGAVIQLHPNTFESR